VRKRRGEREGERRRRVSREEIAEEVGEEGRESSLKRALAAAEGKRDYEQISYYHRIRNMLDLPRRP